MMFSVDIIDLMADIFTPEKRSQVMASIKSGNTKPELMVRSILHRLGFRFRLHRKDLPGRPDIVLAKHRTVVFVHGCFWHMHSGCREGRLPNSRREFWSAKLNANALRDVRNAKALEEIGWRVITVWECELKDRAVLVDRLVRELNL